MRQASRAQAPAFGRSRTSALIAQGGLVLTVSACTSGDTTHATEDSPLGTVSSAYTGTFDDVDSPNANVVVAMSCSGTLVTPQIALTAAHCIWGAEGNGNCTAKAVVPNVTIALVGNDGTGVGQKFEPHPLRGYASRIEHCFGAGDESHAMDIAVVYLKEPVIEHTMFQRSKSHLSVPRVVRPRLVPPVEVDGRYPGPLGVAGFGGLSKTKRQVLLIHNGNFNSNKVGSDYQWEYNDDEGWDSERGDSGSPLFIYWPDGQREVIGVMHGHGSDLWWGRYIDWADITRGENKRWLLRHVQEKSIAPELRHSDGWLARHGKTLEDWWGELDYSGPCDHEHDRDCDGWWDHNEDADHPLHDNCPYVPNPGQEELGPLGGGAACPACPDDPDNDADGDGICGVCSPSQPSCVVDNCPNVYNPDQANCNFEFEEASIARGVSVPILGDACDPVPCPHAQTSVRPPNSCVSGPTFYRDVQDEIVVRPIGPHRLDAISRGTTPPAVAIGTLPTKARFCHESKRLGIDCSDPAVLQDNQLFEERSAEGVLLASPDAPWQRITLREGPAGPAQLRNSNEGFSLRYEDGAEHVFVWDYKADDAFWHRTGLDVIGSNVLEDDCSKSFLFGPGTCLHGKFWTHADTNIGATAPMAAGHDVGIHGNDLANHIFDMAPDRPVFVDGCQIPPIDPCVMQPLGCRADPRTRFNVDTCPMCGTGWRRAAALERIQIPLLPAAKPNSVVGVLWDKALVTGQDLELPPDVQAAFRARTFVSAVESSPPGLGEVDAVALADEPEQGVAEYLTVNEHAYSIVATAHGRVVPTTVARAYTSTSKVLGRTDATVVYSRVMRGAFVLGGRDASGRLVRSVRHQPLYGSGFDLTGQLEGAVFAATLTRPTPDNLDRSYLWSVEETDGGGAELIVRELAGAQLSAPISRVALGHRSNYRYVLTTAWDRPDSVLLTASNAASGAWAIFEVTGLSSSLSFRLLVDRGDRRGHLFRGAYAEENDVLVLPYVIHDAQKSWRPRTERRNLSTLGATMIDPRVLQDVLR